MFNHVCENFAAIDDIPFSYWNIDLITFDRATIDTVLSPGGQVFLLVPRISRKLL